MGDGGFQMTMQELGTIMDYRIPVKMIILNNNFLGNVRQWQSMFYNDRFMGTPLLNPDFAMVSRAYGIPAEDVSEMSQLDAAIERMIKADTAYMLNVNIETEDMVFPMVTPGSAVDEILINRNKNIRNKGQEIWKRKCSPSRYLPKTRWDCSTASPSSSLAEASTSRVCHRVRVPKPESTR